MNLNRKSNLEKGANGLPPRRASLRSPAAVSRKFYGAFSTMTAVAALLAPMRPAIAGPTGGTVVEGSAAISQAGNTTNIDQSTNRAVINWLGFSIGQGETVNFYQPTDLSVTLNRVVGNEQSVIAGALNANGRVFIVNSAGVLFTKDAQVNVGGIVASTLDISNKDFMAGNHVFSGSSKASVVNKGDITASAGGYVSLLGKTVLNEGVITATLGTVALASGEKITLNFGGDSLVDVTIDKGTLNALVENKAAIKADGGRVVLTAKAADAVLSAQVNNTGLVQARTIADLTGGSTSGGSVKIGKIKLLATGGTTKVAGKLDASAPKGGKGGVIDTSGDKVKIADGAVVTTKAANGQNGSWIIDPDGFKIAASGGDITGATLSDQLGSNNVTIYSTSGSGSSGDIDVNDVVAWAANTTLTLNATKSINIDKPIYATGESAGLVLNHGGYASTGSAAAGTDYKIGSEGSVTLLGDKASLTIDGQAYTLIHTLSQLSSLSAPILDDSGSQTYDPDGNPLSTGAAEGHYALARNIDASGKSFSGPVIVELDGTLAGLGHTIDKLTINQTSASVNESAGNFGVALISQLGARLPSDALVRDIGLTNVDIRALAGAAGLAFNNLGTISNAFVTGKLDVGAGGGGGIAVQNVGVIEKSYTNVDITGAGTYIGGLVGYNGSAPCCESSGVIKNSVANGTITITAIAENDESGPQLVGDIGGLLGSNAGGSISNSQANVNVTVTNAYGLIGGLIGSNTFGGSVLNSSATGNVSVRNTNLYAQAGGIGGLAGSNTDGSSISGSSASGSVTASNLGGVSGATVSGVGGLVGANADSSINASYATGSVTGQTTNQGVDGLGGLVGVSNGGSITDSFAGGQVSGVQPGAFVAQTDGTIYSGNSFNTRTSGLTNAVGIGDPDLGGVAATTTTPPGATVVANPSSDFGAASATAQASAPRAVSQSLARLEGVRQSAAALAVARQVAPQVANISMADAQTKGSSRPAPAVSTAAGAKAIAVVAAPKIEDLVKIEEPATQPSAPVERPRAPRQAAATAARKVHAHERGSGYGASIRSIDVDGRSYELNNGRRNGAPGQKAQ